MKLILDQFSSNMPFVQFLYATAEGNEVISLNIQASADELVDYEVYRASLEKLVSKLNLELYPANSNGQYIVSRIPYSFYKGTYPSGLRIQISPNDQVVLDTTETTVEFAWCPSMASYVVNQVSGPEQDHSTFQGKLVMPVLFKHEITMKNISSEKLRAWGLVSYNPFKDWELSFSSVNEDVEQDFGAIVSYTDDDGKTQTEMMDVVCSDSELARALVRNEIKGEDDFQVHALFEYYELQRLSVDGDVQTFMLFGMYEPKQGILERQEIAILEFANLKYTVATMLLPTLADKNADLTMLNQSISKATALGKLN